MSFSNLFSIILAVITPSLCNTKGPNLQIIKKDGNNFTPITSALEERAGSRFSLLCELVFNENSTGYDDHISWIKKQKQFNISADLDSLYSSLKTSDINKAEKQFAPLKLEDSGNYVCFSIKYKQYVVIEVIVRKDIRATLIDNRPNFRETMFCTKWMFKCRKNGFCIIPHYVCDGKPDCKDGSDEDLVNCNGDPCKDKIRCEDGRCIPTSWCCDRNLDVNCTVTNRPKCCQFMTESFEEYTLPTQAQPSNSGAKYLFISVCILSILFSLILLLLILSKLVIFAKKSAMQRTRHIRCGNVTLYQRGSHVGHFRDSVSFVCAIPHGLYEYRTADPQRRDDICNFPNCDMDAVDPLLNETEPRSTDMPPTYQDACLPRRFPEPPPPYRSREVLNKENGEATHHRFEPPYI